MNAATAAGYAGRPIALRARSTSHAHCCLSLSRPEKRQQKQQQQQLGQQQWLGRRRLPSLLRQVPRRHVRAASPCCVSGSSWAASMDDSAVSSQGRHGEQKQHKQGLFGNVGDAVVQGIRWLQLSSINHGMGNRNSGANSTGSPSVISVLARIARLAYPDRGLLIGGVVALVVAAAADLAIPHFVSQTIFTATAAATATDKAAAAAAFQSNAIWLVVFSAAYGIFAATRGLLVSIVNFRLIQRLRNRVFSSIIRQPAEFFDLTDGKPERDVNRCLTTNLNVLLRNLITCVGGGVILLFLCPPLAIITSLVGALHLLVTIRYGAYSRSAMRLNQDLLAASSQVAQEVFSLIKVVRVFGGEDHEVRRYKKRSAAIAGVNARQGVAHGLHTLSSTTLYNTTQILALVVGGTMTAKGIITGATLTSFIFYTDMVLNAGLAVGEQIASLMEAAGACEKVLLLAEKKPAKEFTLDANERQARKARLKELKGHIKFDNICYAYPTRPDTPVLNNVSFEIKPGEVVAVVGRSGSGKSTISALLQGLYQPTKGSIIIDDCPMEDLDLRHLRKHMAVVSQDPRLFSGDVFMNITYASPHNSGNADEGDLLYERVQEAAMAANAHDFTMKLPQAYATLVGEGTLSGGQRQRIAIARALFRNPKILILDEATSALDNESEALVTAALRKIIHSDDPSEVNGDATVHEQQRATMIIAHRLSTIRQCSKIVVLENGQVVEQGSHEQLLANVGGAYWALVNQSAQEDQSDLSSVAA